MTTLAEKLLVCTKETEEPDANRHVEFVSSTPMIISPKYSASGVTLQYSLNGISWTTIKSGAKTPSANIIYFRGSATGVKSLYTDGSQYSNPWTFTGATNLECNGKLDRLLQNTLGGDTDILELGNFCFALMFYNINTLIKAPELPATTLATYCYFRMFQGCTSLITAPELPATTYGQNCCEMMFRGCTNLTTVSDLPVTTLAIGCCYGMFRDCTNLTTVPELPATTLADYCYSNMFQGCTSITTVPKLPATTLVTDCYNSMFYGCTSITTVIELPATTLATYCYYRMFEGCTSLKLSTTLTGIYDTAYRIPTSGTGIIATTAITDMFKNTGGTFVGTPQLNTTYYTENTPV